MHAASLRKLCEFQVLALVFALPFEFYFLGRYQSLYTSLKLQLLLLTLSWAALKLAELAALRTASWRQFVEPLPARLLCATASFLLVQLLAAAFAPEFRGNALNAGAKAGLGVLLSIAAADLYSRARAGYFIGSLLYTLSASGTCVALLGLGNQAGARIFTDVVRIFQSTEYSLGNRLRLASTMEYPNTAGAFLSVALCATLALTVSGRPAHRPRAWRLTWPVLIGIQGLALALTYSRGALFSTIIAVLAATWTMSRFLRQRHAVIAVTTVLALLLGGTSITYYVRHEVESHGSFARKRVARYGLGAADERRFLIANRTYQETVAVENDSTIPWRRGRHGIAYRWYSLSDGRTLSSRGTVFPDDVAPGQKVQATVPLNSPSPGEYLLIWFLFDGNESAAEVKDSYSPGILCTVGNPGEDPTPAISGKARRYLAAIREERRNLDVTARPRRPELWLAAIRMGLSKPLLGIGPDNFRLRKWEFMEVPKGDDTILANSLYLETLAGSGLSGLACLLWLLWEFSRRIAVKALTATSPSERVGAYFGTAYLAGLLSHGIVDYFLKFTPIFLMFWLLLGMLCADRGED